MPTYTSAAANVIAPGPASWGEAGQLFSAYGQFTVATALVITDIIEMVKVPAGARIREIICDVPDLDTGGSPAIVLHIGDGGDPDRYVASSTVGQAGGRITAANMVAAGATVGPGFRYADADTIDITVATGPATSATGVTIRMWVDYVLEPTTGTTSG